MIQAINLVMFLGIVIVPGLDHRFGWSQVPTALVIVANLLMLVNGNTAIEGLSSKASAGVGWGGIEA